MFLVRMVYASRVSEHFKSADIEAILAKAREHNANNCVTGMLCFNQTFFLQCLEGSRSKVNQTYRKILNDERHEDIVLLDYKEINHRAFSEWSMGYMPTANLTRDVIIKHSGRGEFLPFEMSGASAMEFMITLRNTIPTV